MKALPNQFSMNGFSGAVATPTCSSSCCCCCCCLTTLITAPVVAAQDVAFQARKNRIVGERKNRATIVAAMALPGALGAMVVLAFLTNEVWQTTMLLPIIGLTILYLGYNAAYRDVMGVGPQAYSKARKRGVFMATMALLAFIGEFIIGGAVIMSGFSGGITPVIIYLIAVPIVSILIISRKNKQLERAR